MPVDPKRVRAVFLLAVEQADCAVVRDRECGTNAALRRRVEALLVAHNEPGSLLGRPAVPPGQTVDEISANRPADSAPPDPRPAEDIGIIVAGRCTVLEPSGDGGMRSVFMADRTRLVKRMLAGRVPINDTGSGSTR